MKLPQLQKLITRGEIAQLLGVTERFVSDNEARLGLLRCKVVLSKQLVRYRQDDALKALDALGVR